jgi:ribosomal protein S27AE
VGIIGLVISRNKKSAEVSQNENTTKSGTSIDSNTPQNPKSDAGDRLVFQDSDNDGINDDKDGCPEEKGPKANNGCPYADYDRDGVPDKDDLCKYVPGPKYNDGCPNEEQISYRTQCPYCGNLSYERSSDKQWRCGDCGKIFFNCYRNSEGDHDGIKLEWFNDGTCDCSLTCADE